LATGYYVDTSALLRVTLELGTTPDLEERIFAAEGLVASRLSRVEAARALLRIRRLQEVPESRLADVERELEMLLRRCELWELTAEVCDLAARVAPQRNLRALDALHLATFLLARRHAENLELLTADKRLQEAADTT